MQVYLRSDFFYEVATSKSKTLLGTLGTIGGLFSILHKPLNIILSYIAQVSFEATIINELFFKEGTPEEYN